MTICTQSNVNGYYRRLPELQQLLSHHHPCVLALQETRLQFRNKVKLYNYNIYSHDLETISHAKDGWTIFVSNAYNVTLLSTPSEIQNIAVSVSLPQIEKINITICSIYIFPNQNISNRTLQQLIQTLLHLLIIHGDFYAHSSTWGSKHLNTKVI